MRKILFILCLLVSFYNYAQEEKKILKVTYTKTSFITPEGDFETFLYVNKDKLNTYIPKNKKQLVKITLK